MRVSGQRETPAKPARSPTAEDIELSGIRRILPDIARALSEEERGPVAYVYSRGGRGIRMRLW
jgi:tetrathionate reductase subunit A